MSQGALGRGCGRKVSRALLLPRAAVISTPLGYPLAKRKMLAGLRSRCRMLRSWRDCTPRHICTKRDHAAASGSGPLRCAAFR